MVGVSPGGLAENGTLSGNGSLEFCFMRLIFPNPLSYLPSLATGLVPVGHHYYEGSDFRQRPQRISPTTDISFPHPARSQTGGAWNLKLSGVPRHYFFFDGFSVVCIWRISLLISMDLPSIPSPTTLLPFLSPRFTTLPVSVHRARRFTDRRLTSLLKRQTIRSSVGHP